jgi:hypothetical protein
LIVLVLVWELLAGSLHYYKKLLNMMAFASTLP